MSAISPLRLFWRRSTPTLGRMNTIVASLVSGLFIVLALWHIRMALGSMSGESGAVPSVDGKPLFQPSRRATLAVAVVLFIFAGLVAGAAGKDE